MGTASDKTDVVSSGITQPAFTKYRRGHRGNRTVVPVSELVSTFYIQRKSPFKNMFSQLKVALGRNFTAPPLLAGEPVVFSHRPICNPWINHTLAHSVVKASRSLPPSWHSAHSAGHGQDQGEDELYARRCRDTGY